MQGGHARASPGKSGQACATGQCCQALADVRLRSQRFIGYQTKPKTRPELAYGNREHRLPFPEQHVLRDAADTRSRDGFLGVRDLRATFTENGTLLTLQRGASGRGFRICKACGAAASEGLHGDKPVATDSDFGRGGAGGWCGCGRNSDPWRNRVLAATQQTDFLMVDLPPHVSQCGTIEHAAAARSMNLAMHRALCDRLEIDRREVGAMLLYGDAGSERLAWWDTSDGGSGHVFDAFRADVDWLADAATILRGTPEHDDSCAGACMHCLLDHDTYRDLEQGRLDRHAGLKLIDALRDHRQPLGGPAERATHAAP